MKLSEYIAKVIEEIETKTTNEVSVVVCLDTEMNVVNDGWNQVKFTIARKEPDIDVSDYYNRIEDNKKKND